MNVKRISAATSAMAISASLISASLTSVATAQVQNPSEQYNRFDNPPKLCTGDTWTLLDNEYIAATPWASTVQSVTNGVATILCVGVPEVGDKRERTQTRLANGNIHSGNAQRSSEISTFKVSRCD
jgi:hypothetical protein